MILNPWRALRRAEHTLHLQAASIQTLSKELVKVNTEYGLLVERMIQMRREGFVAPPRPEEVPERQPLPAKVLRAVVAVGEPGLDEHARGLLAAGLSEAEVAAQVLAGGAIPL